MFLILFLIAAPLWSQMADLVVENANIYTMDAARPHASRLAIRDGIILALDEDADRLTGASTRRLDAKGATIVPGFIDSHAHVEHLGRTLESLHLRGVTSIDAVAAMVAEAARKLPAGAWIRGNSWDQTNWGGAFPTAEPLTKAAPNHPVYLTRVDGHASWVNAKALALAGVGKATPDPPGGKIVRAADGTPTGVLIDAAQALVARRIPDASPADVKRWIEQAAWDCARQGLTSVHDAGAGRAELAAYRELIAEHRLPIRVNAMIGGAGRLWREYLRKGPEIGDRLTVRSIKLLIDGAMGSRGAAFYQPYSDDPGNSGLLLMTQEDVARVAREAVRGGFQVATHAIGDKANRMVLDAYASALGGHNDKRFRIEHAQVVADADFALFAKYSVIASMQATHATSDMRWAEQRVGPVRVKGAYAWRRFLEIGVPIANGSDFPVEEPNPLWGFYAAVTRQDRDGKPAGGWFPDQRMTREEALRSWTITGAYAAFEEKRKGSLAPGKMADLVLLSADIMKIAPAEILKTRVLATVVGGEVVYDGRR
jgi:predicted amidohydrolase YtcJ